jgi:hypothetical protein
MPLRRANEVARAFVTDLHEAGFELLKIDEKGHLCTPSCAGSV